MKRSRTSVVWLWLALLSAFACRVESQKVPRDLRLGFSGCAPAVFFTLQPEMTTAISDITYADTTIAGRTYTEAGMLKSFKQQISRAGGSPIALTVTVNLGKWTGECSSLEYSTDVAGNTQTSSKYDIFDQSKLPRSVAFSPEENAGVIVAGGPLQRDLVTEFGYDDKNRRSIRRQVFGIGGVTYEVSYSDYGYKGPPTGKLSSFTARIRMVPR